MTKHQLAEVRTLRMVFRLLNRSQTIWNGVPAMGVQLNVLGAKLEYIEALAQEQEEDKTGLRVDKSRLSEQLIAGVMRIAGPLGAWALIAQEERARILADVTPGALRKLAAERLVHEAKLVHEAAKAHLPKLSDYSISAEALEVLQSRIAGFNELVLVPKEGINRTVALTGLLAGEIDSAMELLRGFFDRMIYVWQTDQPEFFANYQAATRFIRPPRGRRTKEEIARAREAEAKAAAAKEEKAEGNKEGHTITALPVVSAPPQEADNDDDANEEASVEEVRAVFAEAADPAATDRAPAPAGAGEGSGQTPRPVTVLSS